MKRIRSINQSIQFLLAIQTTLLIISAVCITGCSSLVGKVGITGKPNVLFILADDFGYSDLSWFSHPRRYQKGKGHDG